MNNKEKIVISLLVFYIMAVASLYGLGDKTAVLLFNFSIAVLGLMAATVTLIEESEKN